VIKTYSPNLMVHPLMRSSTHTQPNLDTAPKISAPIIDMLSRIHVLVIGPGLGRDSLMQDTCALVIRAARDRSLPFVLDADGLYLAQTRPELVQGYPLCILTPNVVEFARLAKSKGIEMPRDEKEAGGSSEQCEKLAAAFGGVTIIQKGERDFISDSKTTYISDLEGGRKRSGGQGDTLTGSLATFLAWRKAYLDRIWE
jgi:ATP-dependent NAD(P)H-hydrate dehydratase